MSTKTIVRDSRGDEVGFIQINPRFWNELSSNAIGVFEEFIDVAIENASMFVPRITGHLARSITHRQKAKGVFRSTAGGLLRTGIIWEGIIFTETGGTVNQKTGKQVKVGYGAHVELGTKKRRAKPYLLPGIRVAQAEIIFNPRSWN
jgi:hypothetical protein